MGPIWTEEEERPTYCNIRAFCQCRCRSPVGLIPVAPDQEPLHSLVGEVQPPEVLVAICPLVHIIVLHIQFSDPDRQSCLSHFIQSALKIVQSSLTSNSNPYESIICLAWLFLNSELVCHSFLSGLTSELFTYFGHLYACGSNKRYVTLDSNAVKRSSVFYKIHRLLLQCLKTGNIPYLLTFFSKLCRAHMFLRDLSLTTWYRPLLMISKSLRKSFTFGSILWVRWSIWSKTSDLFVACSNQAPWRFSLSTSQWTTLQKHRQQCLRLFLILKPESFGMSCTEPSDEQFTSCRIISDKRTFGILCFLCKRHWTCVQMERNTKGRVKDERTFAAFTHKTENRSQLNHRKPREIVSSSALEKAVKCTKSVMLETKSLFYSIPTTENTDIETQKTVTGNALSLRTCPWSGWQRRRSFVRCPSEFQLEAYQTARWEPSLPHPTRYNAPSQEYWNVNTSR